MFELIDRVDKEARVFYVMNDKRKENLLYLVNNNVYIIDVENEDNEFETRIYSDCFSF